MSKGIKIGQPDEVLQELRSLITYDRNQSMLAAELGVSQAFMSAVLRGQKMATDEMLERIGWKRTVTYTKVGGATNEHH